MFECAVALYLLVVPGIHLFVFFIQVLNRTIGSHVELGQQVIDFLHREYKAVLCFCVGVAYRELLREKVYPLGIMRVPCFDVFAGATDGQQVEQLEIIQSERIQQILRCALFFRQMRPVGEGRLRHAGGIADAFDAMRLQEIILITGYQQNLVAQVAGLVVDRGGRQQQDSGLDSSLYNLTHQEIIAGGCFICLGGAIAEIMGFVNDNEVIIPPFHRVQGSPVAHAAGTPQICMVEQVVIERLLGKLIEFAIVAVGIPVLSQALGAKYQHLFVHELVIAYDCQSLVCLT